MSYNFNNHKKENRERSKNIDNWLNNYGYPNFNYLHSLAQKDDPEALDELKLIADDLDVDYYDSISANELVDRIVLAVSQKGDDQVA